MYTYAYTYIAIIVIVMIAIIITSRHARRQTFCANGNEARRQ